MATSTEIKQRANALAGKTDVNSITPKEVGGIMYDLASHGENVLRNGGTLGIRKVYESVAAMEADGINPIDLWGDPIKKGNLVVIYDGTTTGVDNNKIYAFMKPGWELATHLDAGYATKAETDAKLAELELEVGLPIKCVKIISNGTVNSANTVEDSINGYNLFIYLIGQFERITVSNGDLYCFFDTLPSVGTTSTHYRVVSTLDKSTINVEDKYIGIRSNTDVLVYGDGYGLIPSVEELKKETSKNSADISKTNLNTINLEGYIELEVKGEKTKIVGATEMYGGELPNLQATNEDAQYSIQGQFYSVCGVPKGVKINNVSLLSPTTDYTPTLLIGTIEEDSVNIVGEYALSVGNGNSYVDNIINHLCNSDVVLFVDAFYFKTLTTDNNIPLVIRRNGTIVNKGRVDLAMSVKIKVSGIIDNINKPEILELEKTIYGDSVYGYALPDVHNYVDEGNLQCYEFAKLKKGDVISKIMVLSKESIQPPRLYIVKDDGTYSIIKKLVLNNPKDGQYVATSVNYTATFDCILFIARNFAFVVDDNENKPLVGSSNGANIINLQTGKSGLGYGIKLYGLGLEDRVNSQGTSMDVMYQCSDISMFENIGFCGDSYMAGMIVVSENPTVTAENSNLAWGKILERTHGIKASLFARGATSTVDVSPNAPNFLTEPRCLPALLAADPQNLYVISLGHNDCYISANQESFGKTWTKEGFIAEFKTNYNSIISAIQSHAPKAKIIICMQSKPYVLKGWGADINLAIKEVAESHGLPYLNPEDDAYLSSDEYVNTMVHDHPVFAGYAGIAKAFDRLFCKATIDFWDYFKGYTGL